VPTRTVSGAKGKCGALDAPVFTSKSDRSSLKKLPNCIDGAAARCCCTPKDAGRVAGTNADAPVSARRPAAKSIWSEGQSVRARRCDARRSRHLPNEAGIAPALAVTHVAPVSPTKTTYYLLPSAPACVSYTSKRVIGRGAHRHRKLSV